ncbi:pseudouridine-5'-phosphate glycosidase [Catelliglobosispora koreensis]|uniref:pseudouridine-5'-phosphate glycosidase n=1 Tax=Catelliglobosispora koreensis TaxID=129052 RepID=UPI00058E78C6|nr:pseudouridine-5'-phosphate glycosidase [Catelliglobosispora koreensis]
MPELSIRLSDEVRSALAAKQPVVALESTIISHGLPRPDNLRIAREIEQTVRDNGAVPATIGMLDGQLWAGLDDEALKRLATSEDVVKLSVRDLGIAAASSADGATTVASTSAIAAAMGIKVFATGGLGGVHREAAQTFDESADLVTLAQTPIVVVSAGVKSILDVGATLERLETLGVGLVGYQTKRFPGFFITDSGFSLDWQVDSAEQAAQALKAQEQQGVHHAALVVANPLPESEQLDTALHDRVLAEGLSIVERDRVSGKQVTPVLLGHFHSATEGKSLEVNVRIILRNAALAAQIAAAYAKLA